MLLWRIVTYKYPIRIYDPPLPPHGGVVGNMLASHDFNPGSIRGPDDIDSDNHCNDGPLSLDPQ